ncbi:MAG: restriction endonuclease subunit S [Bacteroidota bacterium]|nr:restriction endonuclease subunit S [Bacteroidota bacterium]
MITIGNLRELLTSLNFENTGNIFSKYFINSDSELKVDFGRELLIYPEGKGLIVNEHQTCNFSANENFVVFECVHRLLEKGYKPEHLELEPKWKIGHGASGGRADILIRDNSKKPLLLIECKTEGKEFKDAWKDTLVDGDQLFSYVQQIPDTEFLCLYTSDFTSAVDYSFTSFIISHKDNAKILEDNKSLKSFDKAKNVKDRFLAWKDTYKLEFTTKGIFELNIQPYQIGKDKYTIEDLLPVDVKNKEGKYHEFRTILRKHNVSGRENAFDVLVNLFLCKIVDESQNPKDLKFYWKGIAYDNYYDLIDRLQELYKIGMDKFLAQEIVYISNKEIDEAFWTVKQKRNATKQQIKEYFRKLKFFTNSDFSFIDVHNERLFYQNAKVLLEIVQMWQDLQLKTTDHNQFLGDMFEFFLDNGIKQSEGQFFTPLPICKFILMSLPIETIIKSQSEQPKAIDYACGAGHFLTELASQITPFVKLYRQSELSEFYKNIYGIEKEYRLSKVAKLSSFMYGHEGIEILHHDALGAHGKIKESSFDILVANPPFSVEGFLDTLSEEERSKYILTETVSDIANNRNIQCFFLERAKQLLAPNGVAGIIIPSSVLNNSDGTHIATREILIQYFDIVALVELGSGTFGKTGTSTIVLFIRRKAQKPEPAKHYLDRVNDWFEGINKDKESEVYQDLYLIKKYCDHIEVSFDTYLTLMNGYPSDKLLKQDIFKEYVKEFDASAETKNLKTKKYFKELTSKEKKSEIGNRFNIFLQKIEKDKLYHFILAYTNPQNVLIVKSPSDTKEQKNYLGYEWSAAKGSEGIKYNNGNTVDQIITPLFDPQNRNNVNKINYFVQQNYLNAGISNEFPESLKPFIDLVPLVDLLDFSRKDFTKTISVNPKKNIIIKTKWELVNMENVCKIVRGASPRPIDKYITKEKDGINWIKIGDVNVNDKYITQTGEKITIEGAKKSRLVKVGDFILSNSMSFGRPYILKISGCIHDGWLLMTDFRYDLDKNYLYEILSFEDTQRQFIESAAGGVVKNLNIERVKSTRISIPPISVQKTIVKECKVIDLECEKAYKNIKLLRRKNEEKVKAWFANNYEMKKLDDLTEIKNGGTPDTNNPLFWTNGSIFWATLVDTKSKYLFSTQRKITKEGLDNSSAQLLPINTVIFSSRATIGEVTITKVETCTNQGYKNFICNPDLLHYEYLYYVLKNSVKEIEKLSSGMTYKEINTKSIKNFRIPTPALNVQKRLVQELETVEKQITVAEHIIQESLKRKQSIMRKYL